MQLCYSGGERLGNFGRLHSGGVEGAVLFSLLAYLLGCLFPSLKTSSVVGYVVFYLVEPAQGELPRLAKPNSIPSFFSLFVFGLFFSLIALFLFLLTLSGKFLSPLITGEEPCTFSMMLVGTQLAPKKTQNPQKLFGTEMHDMYGYIYFLWVTFTR